LASVTRQKSRRALTTIVSVEVGYRLVEQMELIRVNVFGAQLVGGLSKVAGKVRDGSQIELLCMWREPTKPQIFQHALT
jgi:hypothetical protein